MEILTLSKNELLGELLQPFLKFFKQINKETFPEEKPWNDDQITGIVKMGSDMAFRICAIDAGQMIAYSSLDYTGCKPGYGKMFVNVLPQYRRQGIGSGIFSKSIAHAREMKLSKIVCQTHHQTGEEFMFKRGGRVIAKESTRTLLMADVNWNLLNKWIDNGKNSNPSLELVFTRQMEDSMIPGLAQLSLDISRDLMALHGNPLEITYEFEVEEWKRRQKAAESPNESRIFLFVQESCGDIVGYTNISIQNSDLTFARQGMTAVKKECRGAGIGKLLKATMLQFLNDSHPEIVKVSTGNNDLNAPMVAINEMLGFSKGVCWTSYEIDTGLIPFIELTTGL